MSHVESQDGTYVAEWKDGHTLKISKDGQEYETIVLPGPQESDSDHEVYLKNGERAMSQNKKSVAIAKYSNNHYVIEIQKDGKTMEIKFEEQYFIDFMKWSDDGSNLAVIYRKETPNYNHDEVFFDYDFYAELFYFNQGFKRYLNEFLFQANSFNESLEDVFYLNYKPGIKWEGKDTVAFGFVNKINDKYNKEFQFHQENGTWKELDIDIYDT